MFFFMRRCGGWDITVTILFCCQSGNWNNIGFNHHDRVSLLFDYFALMFIDFNCFCIASVDFAYFLFSLSISIAFASISIIFMFIKLCWFPIILNRVCFDLRGGSIIFIVFLLMFIVLLSIVYDFSTAFHCCCTTCYWFSFIFINVHCCLMVFIVSSSISDVMQ